jgi:DUF4097 and DUF4098 domain-containing protein YvlB
MAMNWRMLAAVLFVFACAYGIVGGLRYGRSRVGAVAAAVMDEIEISTQPRFEVARGTRTLPAYRDKRLRIENTAGSVKVVPGGPGTTAEYVISAPGENEAEARRRASAVEVQVVHIGGEGDRVRVKARGRMPAGVTVALVVRTPPDRQVSVKTVSASIEVTGMQGDVAAESVSGEISVGSGAGSVTAHTVSGGIGIVGAQGKTEARSTSGSVNLANLHSNDIAARTVSGSIEIEVTDPFAGRLEATSVSGGIAISLPRPSNFEARATSVSGGISGAAWQSSVGRKAYARLASGQGSVTLSTTSGSIDLTLTD